MTVPAHQLPELELLAMAKRPRTLSGQGGDVGGRCDLRPAPHTFTLEVKRAVRGRLFVEVQALLDGYRWCAIATWKLDSACVETSVPIDLEPLHRSSAAARPRAAVRVWYTIEGEATFGVRAREVRP